MQKLPNTMFLVCTTLIMYLKTTRVALYEKRYADHAMINFWKAMSKIRLVCVVE